MIIFVVAEKFKDFLDILNHSLSYYLQNTPQIGSFLVVEIIKEYKWLLTDVLVTSTDTRQYLHTTSCPLHHSKNPYQIVKICFLTGFIQRINFLIRGVMV